MNMRSIIDLVSHPQDLRVDRFLRESSRLDESVLLEGSIGDRINAVTKKVANQYGDVQYAFLAKATMKALDIYGKGSNANPQVAAALTRVAKIAKFAMQNRALLSVLLGIVSTLIGIAAHPSPAGAGEASQIDMLLQGKGLDEILDKLHKSGIEIGSVDSSALPQGVSAIAAKAAKALVAIERYKFVQGGHLSSSRELINNVSMVGTVEKTQSHLHEVVTLMTNDGRVTLARIDTSYSINDGQIIDDPSETGVEFQLGQYVRGRTPAATDAAENYLDQAINKENSIQRQASGMQEGASGVMARIRSAITGKAPDLGKLLAQAVVGRPDGRYKVTISANGVNVEQID